MLLAMSTSLQATGRRHRNQGSRLGGRPCRVARRPVATSSFVPAADRFVVPAMDQQPLRLRRARLRPSIGPDQDEPAANLLPLEPDLQLARAKRCRRVALSRLGRPAAPVPHDDVATTVLSGRDHALEPEVAERMVLDLDGQPPCRRVHARTARHGPRREHTADLEAEVVMEPAGSMAMDDEATAGLRRFATRPTRRSAVALAIVGLGRAPKVALGPVRAQAHDRLTPTPAMVTIAGATADRRDRPGPSKRSSRPSSAGRRSGTVRLRTGPW